MLNQKTKIDFRKVFSQLERKGIIIKPSSFRENKHQGWMSTVYAANSNHGDLIFHFIKPSKEWIHQKIWKKLFGIATLLVRFPTIPTSEFLLEGKIKDTYFFVQKRVPGKPAGKRLLVNDVVVDVWFGKEKKRQLANLQKIVADVHKIKRKGYGWPIVKNNEVRGQYPSWKAFFKKETPLWLRSIQKGDLRLGNGRELQKSLIQIKERVRYVVDQIPQTSSVLIHGDAINPSNVLVKKGTVTGLLDWEWAMIGDPAWEFCDPGWWPLLNKKDLGPYFKAMSSTKKEVANLLKRARTYRVLWLLWAAHMHAEDKGISGYRALRKMLADEARKLRS